MMRRTLLKAFPFIGIAVAMPVAASQPETITDRIDRLTEELSAAMAEYQGGKFQAIVEPGGDVHFVPIKSAERAKFYGAALAGALNEINPGDWRSTLAPEDGFAMLARHEPHKTFSVYGYTDHAPLNRSTKVDA